MGDDKKIDITSTAIEKSIDLVKEFLGKLIGPPIEEVGLLMADSVKLWRFKNQIKILQKAQAYVEKKNIQPKQIPLKILVPLLENASLEEEESLQDKWAALIVNLADSEKHYESNIFPYLLSQINNKEAALLDRFFQRSQKESIQESNGAFTELPYTEDHFFYPYIHRLHINNLVRLGLLKSSLPIHESSAEAFVRAYYINSETEESEILLTMLGYEFVKACTFE